MIKNYIKHIPFLANKRICWLFCLFAVFLLLAGITNYAYYKVKTKPVNVEKFTAQLHKKEALTENLLAMLVKQVQEKGINSVSRSTHFYDESEKNGIALFIIKGDSLCWWSSNIADVRSAGEVPFAVQFYMVTRSCSCIGVQRADSLYRYVALAKVKQRVFKGGLVGFSNFNSDFSIPEDVELVDHDVEGASPIFSSNGSYLFSLQQRDLLVYNSFFFYATILFLLVSLASLFSLCVLLCRLVRYEQLPRGVAAAVGFAAFCFVCILAFLGWPESVFNSSLFSSAYYSSALAVSLGHLAVYTVAFFLLYLLFKSLSFPFSVVKLQNVLRPVFYVVAMQLLAAVGFLLAYCLTVHLVHKSTMDVTASLVQDISFVTIASLLLVIPWFFFSFYLGHVLARTYSNTLTLKTLLLCRLATTLVGLLVALLAGAFSAHFVAWAVFSFVSLCAELYCYFQIKRTIFYTAFVAFLLINLTVAVCHLHCGKRNDLRYQQLAEQLTANSKLVRNVADENLLLSNGKLILSDGRFHELMADSSALFFENLEHYLLETYFDGFGNKYEFDVQVRSSTAPFTIRQSFYDKSTACSPSLLGNYCDLVADSKFLYICKRPDVPLAYLCAFPHKGKVAYVLLYPCLSICRQEQNAAAYSNSSGSGSFNKFSVTKYYGNEQLFASGEYHYPNTASWIPNVNKRNFTVYKSDCTHYVSRFFDSGYIVVTKTDRGSYTYFIFVSYLCGFFAFGILVYGLFVWFSMKQRHAQYSFLTRMQIWLLGPLLMAFIILAACSMYFFMGQYRDKAISSMSEQAGSIQHNLQHNLGFATSLAAVDQRRFYQDVKDLSSLFRADVIIYDASGRQIISSITPFLYKRRPVNRLIYPQPHFLRQSDFFREARIGSYQFFSYYTKLYNQRNQFIGYVNLRSSAGAEQMRNELFNLMVILVDVYLVIVVLTIIISWLISRRFTKPVTMLADQFKEIKLTGSNQKVDYADNDEFGSLVQQYNIMVDKLHTSAEQLAQSQRELAWRDMARRIAHEIKNPLTPMKLSVQMAQMKIQRDPENFPEYFQRTSSLLIEQIDNLSRIASEFSTFAKTTVTVREEVDLASKVQSVVALFENNAEGVTFLTDMHGITTAMVWSDNKQILQVFNNLFRNAIQAIPDGVDGVVKVDFQIKDSAAFISISDNGCGIPEQNLQTIFEPNFTTKTSGMGLGLSIVKTIVNLASGDIWVESQVGVGTTFFISIPLIKTGEKTSEVVS